MRSFITNFRSDGFHISTSTTFLYYLLRELNTHFHTCSYLFNLILHLSILVENPSIWQLTRNVKSYNGIEGNWNFYFTRITFVAIKDWTGTEWRGNMQFRAMKYSNVVKIEMRKPTGLKLVIKGRKTTVA